MVQICMAANLKPILKMHDNHLGGQIYQFVAKRKLTNVSVQPPHPTPVPPPPFSIHRRKHDLIRTLALSCKMHDHFSTRELIETSFVP